ATSRGRRTPRHTRGRGVGAGHAATGVVGAAEQAPRPRGSRGGVPVGFVRIRADRGVRRVVAALRRHHRRRLGGGRIVGAAGGAFVSFAPIALAASVLGTFPTGRDRHGRRNRRRRRGRPGSALGHG